ncbi:MAG TPA: peptide-methionine (R)-S-oxide reductase MsrB [Pirellulales bacterium]|nr:peptide-methionine (R)-S-oxide reductase MsrB [Pirellulales bacterium]
MAKQHMRRPSVFKIPICVLVAALTVCTAGGLPIPGLPVAGMPVARGAVKAGDKAKGDKAPKEVSESPAPAGSAKEVAAKGERAETERGGKPADDDPTEGESEDDLEPVHKTDREWKRLLSLKEYRVTRQKETELPFSGKYVHTKKEGVYRCVCCGGKLFGSDTKFDSGTGWPSFYAPLNEKAIGTAADYSDGTLRMEVTCSRCDAHLGHVFGDGPAPTGLRYCINSVALKLQESPKPGSTPGGKSKNVSGGRPDGKKRTRDR